MRTTRVADVPLASLPEDVPCRVERDGDAVVVLRTGGVVRAWRDVCPHAGWRLSEGEMVDGRLECPGHGWRFDVESGRCVDVPAYALAPVAVACDGERVALAWESE
jgi:nitrite reductase/ring-hydroxylating ferredoxin subunit